MKLKLSRKHIISNTILKITYNLILRTKNAIIYFHNIGFIMNYYYSFVALVLFVLISRDIYLRCRGLKFVTVSIEDKDGTKRLVTFRTVKDYETEALIKSIKDKNKTKTI
jgi:hypothetical protein